MNSITIIFLLLVTPPLSVLCVYDFASDPEYSELLQNARQERKDAKTDLIFVAKEPSIDIEIGKLIISDPNINKGGYINTQDVHGHTALYYILKRIDKEHKLGHIFAATDARLFANYLLDDNRTFDYESFEYVLENNMHDEIAGEKIIQRGIEKLSGTEISPKKHQSPLMILLESGLDEYIEKYSDKLRKTYNVATMHQVADIQDVNGETALMIAIRKCNYDTRDTYKPVALLMLEDDINEPTQHDVFLQNKTGNNAVHYLFTGDPLYILRAILEVAGENVANLNVPNNNGMTPMSLAIKAKQGHQVLQMIYAGCPDPGAAYGKLALQLVVAQAHEDWIKEALYMGIPVEKSLESNPIVIKARNIVDKESAKYPWLAEKKIRYKSFANYDARSSSPDGLSDGNSHENKQDSDGSEYRSTSPDGLSDGSSHENKYDSDTSESRSISPDAQTGAQSDGSLQENGDVQSVEDQPKVPRLHNVFKKLGTVGQNVAKMFYNKAEEKQRRYDTHKI